MLQLHPDIKGLETFEDKTNAEYDSLVIICPFCKSQLFANAFRDFVHYGTEHGFNCWASYQNPKVISTLSINQNYDWGIIGCRINYSDKTAWVKFYHNSSLEDYEFCLEDISDLPFHDPILLKQKLNLLYTFS